MEGGGGWKQRVVRELFSPGDSGLHREVNGFKRGKQRLNPGKRLEVEEWTAEWTVRDSHGESGLF